jgi:hypothetical protein
VLTLADTWIIATCSRESYAAKRRGCGFSLWPTGAARRRSSQTAREARGCNARWLKAVLLGRLEGRCQEQEETRGASQKGLSSVVTTASCLTMVFAPLERLHD